MATVKMTFSCDDNLDRDILDFLETVPKKRRSDVVRRALRLWVDHQTSQPLQQAPIQTPVQSESTERRKPSLSFSPEN